MVAVTKALRKVVFPLVQPINTAGSRAGHH